MYVLVSPRGGLACLLSAAVALGAGASAARAATLHATPSNFSSVFASSKGGDTILLAAGDYGSFTGGSKSSTVTITPASGATATMSVSFNPSDHIRLDGLTMRSVTLLGTTHDITVANSRFTGQAVMRAEQMVNANIVFDNDTFANINVCNNCYEGRLQVAGEGSGPSGITIKNSTFGPGGDADGIQDGGWGVQILNNEFTGIREIDAVHSDALQLYGQQATVIRGNYFHDSDTDIMAPDGGDHEQITNNVFVGGGNYQPAIQLGSQDTTTFTHNTVKNLDVFMDKKSDSPNASRNGVVQNNVIVGGSLHVASPTCSNCTVAYNLFDSSNEASGSHTEIGMPRFTGGSNPGTYNGYALAAGSPGKGDASDGTDRGINTTGASPSPTPTPTPTPRPTPTPTPTPKPSPTPTPTPRPTPTPTPTPTDVPAKAVWTVPSNAHIATPVTLDGTRSKGNAPLTCTWSFENQDGSIIWETANGCRITKTFDIPDTKYVKLTVKDADGDTDANRQSFAVTALPSGTPTPIPTVPPLATATPLPIPPAPTGLPSSRQTDTGRAASAAPLAAFGFDERRGATAFDASGHHLRGAIRGATRTRLARHGRALRFDGHRDVVRVPALRLGTSATFEAWLRPIGRTRRAQTLLLHRRGRSMDYALYAVGRPARPAGAAGAGRAASAQRWALPAGRWTHLALTYDGSLVRVFVNGVLAATRQARAPLAGAGPLLIGGDGRHGFRGAIDDVRVYGTPLSPAAIRADMRAAA